MLQELGDRHTSLRSLELTLGHFRAGVRLDDSDFMGLKPFKSVEHLLVREMSIQDSALHLLLECLPNLRSVHLDRTLNTKGEGFRARRCGSRGVTVHRVHVDPNLKTKGEGFRARVHWSRGVTVHRVYIDRTLNTKGEGCRARCYGSVGGIAHEAVALTAMPLSTNGEGLGFW